MLPAENASHLRASVAADTLNSAHLGSQSCNHVVCVVTICVTLAALQSQSCSHIAYVVTTCVTLAAYMQADAKAIESCLTAGSIGMSRAIMEAVASGSVTTVVDVQRFVKCTLLAATSDFQVSCLPHTALPVLCVLGCYTKKL